ncbi:MAG: hypothetical protein IJN45_08935 [Alistipes sp.]|nr:hypothetical protein [Alistipes sp.]MBQ6989253.1 hypothetical protein [Alistipes sp.]
MTEAGVGVVHCTDKRNIRFQPSDTGNAASQAVPNPADESRAYLASEGNTARKSVTRPCDTAFQAPANAFYFPNKTAHIT